MNKMIKSFLYEHLAGMEDGIGMHIMSYIIKVTIIFIIANMIIGLIGLTVCSILGYEKGIEFFVMMCLIGTCVGGA